jgi:hypothetical protein
MCQSARQTIGVNLEIPNSIEKKSNLAKRRTHVEKAGLLNS